MYLQRDCKVTSFGIMHPADAQDGKRILRPTDRCRLLFEMRTSSAARRSYTLLDHYSRSHSLFTVGTTSDSWVHGVWS